VLILFGNWDSCSTTDLNKILQGLLFQHNDLHILEIINFYNLYNFNWFENTNMIRSGKLINKGRGQCLDG
jgi:hypothetical protein